MIAFTPLEQECKGTGSDQNQNQPQFHLVLESNQEAKQGVNHFSF